MSLMMEQNSISLPRIWLGTLFIHVLFFCLFILYQFKIADPTKIHLTKGGTLSLLSDLPLLNSGVGQNSRSNHKGSESEGTQSLENEILSFQNSLSYPELALEQSLEDDCSFRVTVAENGGVEKLVVLVPCKFNVFDKQIRNQLQDWKFDAFLGRELILPIRFRIHDRH